MQHSKSELPSHSIEILAKDVATWGEGGVWEIDVIEHTQTTYFFNVRRCPYYEKYREMGLEEFGVEFSCCRDEPFARGLNPRLKLVRTKTIMQGGDVCDFRYHLLPATSHHLPEPPRYSPHCC